MPSTSGTWRFVPSQHRALTTKEHMPLVMKNPGWTGARRFVKINDDGDGEKFLVIHEYENGDWQTSPEFRACMEQAIDWMGKNLDKTSTRERRVMQRMYD